MARDYEPDVKLGETDLVEVRLVDEMKNYRMKETSYHKVVADLPPRTDAEPVGPTEPMSVRLANALVTAAPMTMQQLETARLFYRQLLDMLLQAGPMFSPTREQARILHNTAVRRITIYRWAEENLKFRDMLARAADMTDRAFAEMWRRGWIATIERPEEK